MKHTKLSFTKTFALGFSAAVVAASSASAVLTIDLRASAVTGAASITNDKSVQLTGNVSTVSLQVWGQITNPTPTDNYGVQVILGSIISNNLVGTATGAVTGTSAAGPGPAAPFNQGPQRGGTNGATVSLNADTLSDLGSNSASPAPSHIKLRADPTGNNGGQQFGGVTGVFMPSDGGFALADAAGATINSIANGREFLMGTFRLTMSAISGGSFSYNWVTPVGFSGDSNIGQIAQWTDGDGIVRTPTPTSGGVINVASAVQFTMVPEPSAFGMVLIGALGLVGFRRLGFRRTA